MLLELYVACEAPPSPTLCPLYAAIYEVGYTAPWGPCTCAENIFILFAW